MKVLVLGGDGFCCWSRSLHLSKQEHDIKIVDCLCRPKNNRGLEIDSLTPTRKQDIDNGEPDLIVIFTSQRQFNSRV